MINIAVVEDEKDAAEVLKSYLDRFSEEKKTLFSFTHFDNAVKFLTDYKAKHDIVFMDIELPDLDGMSASRKLRELDKSVTLIFVTNMAQFAIKGYEVDALDFIVKPVSYFNFALKLQKAVDRVESNREREISVSLVGGGVAKLKLSSLKYVEIMGHHMIFHSESGEYDSYGTLKNIEPLLAEAHFVRCNSCYLVNLKYVKSVKGYIVQVGDEKLKISQPKKKEFMKALSDYIGGGMDVPV